PSSTRASHAHSSSVNPSASVLGNAITSGSAHSETKPLHTRFFTPHSSSTKTTARVGPSGRSVRVRTNAYSPHSSTATTTGPAIHSTVAGESPVSRETSASSRVYGEE